MASRPSSYPPSPFVAVFDFHACSDPAGRRCAQPDPWKHAAPPGIHRRHDEPVTPLPPASKPDRLGRLEGLYAVICDLAQEVLQETLAEAGYDTQKRDRSSRTPLSSEAVRIVRHFDNLPGEDPVIDEIISVASELYSLLLEYERGLGQ